MQKVWVWICIVGGCIISMRIVRAFIITTLQPPEEKQIIPVYNGVGTQRATLKNISIKRFILYFYFIFLKTSSPDIV
jgi:hypothetical protein